MVIEKRKSPKNSKPPVSMLGSSAQSTNENKSVSEGGIDYGEMLEPVTDEDKSKKKGRGPSPHYVGLINAFLEKEKESGNAEEFRINLEKLAEAMGKKSISAATANQGLRNNLQKTPGEDGRPLWESIQVSQDRRAGTITLKRRKSKPRTD